jgi:hypothetical protein
MNGVFRVCDWRDSFAPPNDFFGAVVSYLSPFGERIRHAGPRASGSRATSCGEQRGGLAAATGHADFQLIR